MLTRFGVRVLAGCATVVAWSIGLTAPVAAQDFPGGDSWVIQRLEPLPTGREGKPDTLLVRPSAVEYFGEPHVFFYDPSAGDLRHGVWSAHDDVWLFETLDGHVTDANGRVDGVVGMSPSAAVRGDELHVFYYDASQNDLRHGVWTPKSPGWSFDIVDGSVATPRGQQPGLIGLYPS